MGILGVILGLVAIVCAFLATFIFGTIGGVIAGVLAAGAIALGFLKRKKNDGKGGKAAMVIGVLAIVMSISLTNAWSNVFTKLHDKAVEVKPDGLWAQVVENTNGGLMGIIKNLPNDEATMNALVDEMTELNVFAENK